MLFVLFRSIALDKALTELEGTGGTIIQTSLSHEDEDRLRAALAHGAPLEKKEEKTAPKVETKASCCCAAKEAPAYYNNTFEKAHFDKEEREAVYGGPSKEAERALADTEARSKQHRHCGDDAEETISRNASPRSNLHCDL